jgi:hypothetical protein
MTMVSSISFSPSIPPPDPARFAGSTRMIRHKRCGEKSSLFASNPFAVDPGRHCPSTTTAITAKRIGGGAV